MNNFISPIQNAQRVNRIKNNDNTFLLKDCIKSILTGKTPIKSNQKFYEDEFLSWYKPDEIGSQMYLFEAKSKLSKYCYDQKKATIFQPNTLLINAIGDLGRMSILKHEASSNQQITGILFNENVVVEYAYFYLLANRNLFYDGLYNPIMPIINQKKLQNIEIVIPSIEEQKQLIDGLKLIEEIDSYDKINLLENSSFDDDLKDFAYKVFTSKFLNNSISSEITHQLDLIKDLRQAFLREAMQGILVSNETQDGATGADLLAEIQAEKAQLVKEKKIKRPKPLAPISEEEIPFNIPKNWTWCKIDDISIKIGSGSTPKGSNYSESGFPFFRSQNIKNEGLVFDDIKFISDEVQNQMTGTQVLANDLLLNITGGSLGRCALVPNDFEEGNVSQHVCILRGLKVLPKFYHLLVLSPYFQTLIFSSTTGAGREGLPKYNLEQFIVPLPPLEIQERIITKLDGLMGYCDALEEQIKQSQQTNDQLLQQVLREALGA